jgi:hypothetical protein
VEAPNQFGALALLPTWLPNFSNCSLTGFSLFSGFWLTPETIVYDSAPWVRFFERAQYSYSNLLICRDAVLEIRRTFLADNARIAAWARWESPMRVYESNDV